MPLTDLLECIDGPNDAVDLEIVLLNLGSSKFVVLTGEILKTTTADHPHLLVVGTVRNSSHALRTSVEAIEKFFGAFAKVSFYLIESDSSDATVITLGELKASRANFNFESLGELEPKITNRVERIAHCRNEYLEYLEKIQKSRSIPISHLVVADFDGVNKKLSYKGDARKLLRSGTAVCANQEGRYYDILALRCQGWVDEDYRISIKKRVSNQETTLAAYHAELWKKQQKLTENRNEIETHSAFGGLAIYPTALIANCRYRPDRIDFHAVECEHVSFSTQFLEAGGRIIIAPGLRNNGDWRHTWISGLRIADILSSLGKLPMIGKLIDRAFRASVALQNR
jgi:hypothetical protein